MDMENTGKVVARVIIEMLGSPKEHVEKTMRDYVASLKKEKNLTVIAEDFAEAEERDKLFSTFVELDIEFNGVGKLFDFCFESMPSSVEIISPENLVFESSKLTSLLNDLQARLHQVDMSMKTLSAQTAVVDRNAMNVLHNFIRYVLKDGGKAAAEIAPIVGLKGEHVDVFLDNMVTEKKLRQSGGKYFAT
jgi:hypothetical protein